MKWCKCRANIFRHHYTGMCNETEKKRINCFSVEVGEVHSDMNYDCQMKKSESPQKTRVES